MRSYWSQFEEDGYTTYRVKMGCLEGEIRQVESSGGRHTASGRSPRMWEVLLGGARQPKRTNSAALPLRAQLFHDLDNAERRFEMALKETVMAVVEKLRVAGDDVGETIMNDESRTVLVHEAEVDVGYARPIFRGTDKAAVAAEIAAMCRSDWNMPDWEQYWEARITKGLESGTLDELDALCSSIPAVPDDDGAVLDTYFFGDPDEEDSGPWIVWDTFEIVVPPQA